MVFFRILFVVNSSCFGNVFLIWRDYYLEDALNANFTCLKVVHYLFSIIAEKL